MFWEFPPVDWPILYQAGPRNSDGKTSQNLATDNMLCSVQLRKIATLKLKLRRERGLLNTSRVDLCPLQLGRHLAVLAVELQDVVDPLAVAPRHHLHRVLEALAHVDVHHLGAKALHCVTLHLPTPCKTSP